jgi:hypothetical protein
MADRSKASAMVHAALRYENFAFTKDLIEYHKSLPSSSLCFALVLTLL